MIGGRLRSAARWVGAGAVAISWGAWSAEFIRRTSFVAIDGARRYCLFDDAMISMRYARNLIEGHGLVWNPGERVEGITNLLMTLYMALMGLLFGKFDSVLAVQISGAVFLAASGYFSMRIGEDLARSLGASPPAALSLLFFAAPMLYYPLAYWSLMGMETGLLALLALAAVHLAIRSSGDTAFRPGLAAVLALTFLTRPDAAILIAVVMAHRVGGIVGKPGWRRAALAEVGLVAAAVIAVEAFRLAYYGALVPNTYTLKMTGTALGVRISNGLAFVKPFALNAAPVAAVAVAGAIAARNRHFALVLLLVLSQVAYQIYVGGDAWNLWRLMAWAVPLLFVLAAVSLVALARIGAWSDRLLRFSRGWRVPLAPVLVALLAAGAFAGAVLRMNERFEREVLFERPPMYLRYSKINTDQGLVLEELLLPGATVGGTWAGTIPYYSGALGVDFLGKNDPHIAGLEPDLSGALKQYGMNTLPGHNKYDLDHSIKERLPTFIQVYRWGRQDLAIWAFKRYRRVPYKGVPLMLLRDSPLVRWELVPPNYRPKDR